MWPGAYIGLKTGRSCIDRQFRKLKRNGLRERSQITNDLTSQVGTIKHFTSLTFHMGGLTGKRHDMAIRQENKGIGSGNV